LRKAARENRTYCDFFRTSRLPDVDPVDTAVVRPMRIVSDLVSFSACRGGGIPACGCACIRAPIDRIAGCMRLAPRVFG
jgi:hypothetical protein